MNYSFSNKELTRKDIENFKSGDTIICGEWHIEVVTRGNSNFGVITKRGHKHIPLWKVPKYLKIFSDSGLV